MAFLTFFVRSLCGPVCFLWNNEEPFFCCRKLSSGFHVIAWARCFLLKADCAVLLECLYSLEPLQSFVLLYKVWRLCVCVCVYCPKYTQKILFEWQQIIKWLFTANALFVPCELVLRLSLIWNWDETLWFCACCMVHMYVPLQIWKLRRKPLKKKMQEKL